MRVLHLDALRGLAILLVVFYHTFFRWNEYFPSYNLYDDVFFIKNGWLGVELFFMISGFVIFFSLERSRGFTDFIRNRYIRLLPAMLVAIFFIFLYSLLLGPYRPAGIPEFISILPSVTFIHELTLSYFLDTKISPLEGSFWTLYVEMKFYVYISIMYFFLGKDKSFLVTFFIAFLTSCVVFIHSHWGHLNFIFKLVKFSSANFLPWFFIGMVLSYFYKNYNFKYFIVISLCVLLFPFFLYFRNVEVFLFSSILCFVFVFSFHFEFLNYLLCNKLFIFFGFISYPLYLIHENFIVSLSIYVNQFGFVSSKSTGYIAMFISIVISWIIAKYLEPKVSMHMKKIILHR